METNDELEAIINGESHGGRFSAPGDPNNWLNAGVLSALETVRAHCRFASEHLYVNNRRPVYADFLWHSSLNGFAYTTPIGVTPQFDFVGIHVGAILTLIDIFGRIMSHPDNFPDLGDVSKETAARSYIPVLYRSFSDQGLDLCMPLDPVRHHYASILFYNALRYLVSHEIGHLIAGHADFMRSKNNTALPITAASADESNLTRHALEMDADSFAIYSAINEAYRAKEGMENFVSTHAKNKMPMDEPIHQAGKYALSSNKATVQGVCFAVYVFFRIFDRPYWDLANPTRGTHPADPIRQYWIIRTVENLFRKRPKYGYSADGFVEDVVTTIKLAESACANIQNAEPDYRGILSVINAQSSERAYIAKVLDEYARIRPVLDKYKRGRALPD